MLRSHFRGIPLLGVWGEEPGREASDGQGAMGIPILFLIIQLPEGLPTAVVGFKDGVKAEAMDAPWMKRDGSVNFAGETAGLAAGRAVGHDGLEDGPPIRLAVEELE